MPFFQRKIVLAIIGVIVITVTTTIFVLVTSAAPNATPAQTTQANTGTAPPSIAPGSTATHPVATKTPTSATGTPTTTPPTRTIAPTATLATGQQVDWFERVASTGSNTFTLRNHQVTIAVNGQTTYGGGIQSFNQITVGMQLEVRGVAQSNRQVLATVVIQHLDT